MSLPILAGHRSTKKGAQALAKRLEKQGYKVHVRQQYNGIYEITRSVYRHESINPYENFFKDKK